MKLNCEICNFPERKIWPPCSQVPKFEELAAKNWMSLEKCTACKTLWAGVPYEPYSAFTYYVAWNKDTEEWKNSILIEEGNSLHAWHKAQLIFLKDTLTKSDLQHIQHHRERSGGRDPYS